MTVFEGKTGGSLKVELGDSNLIDAADTVFISAFQGDWYPNGDAPAIAAAVLEAAGEVPSDPKGFAVDAELENSHPLSVEVYIEHALYNLKRALAIREYHAKPRVSTRQLEDLQRATTDGLGGVFELHDIERILQAALDSGVLQVPADDGPHVIEPDDYVPPSDKESVKAFNRKASELRGE